MTQVATLARDLIGSMDTDEAFLNAIVWINNRYMEICGKVRFSHLRQLGELYVPPRVSTGSVTCDRDSPTVTGSSTTFLTSPLPTTAGDAGDGWYFKSRSVWYEVGTFDSSTQITLSTNFAETSGSSLSYSLVKRFHTLSTDTRWLGDFVHTRRRLLLETVPIAKLNRDAPARTLTGSMPLYVADAGINSSGERQVELYPYPENSEVLHYVYWTRPPSLAAATATLPKEIDPYVLKEGALIDLYRYLKAKALKKGQTEAAGFYRNDEKAQMAIWERYIQEARRTDRAVDDTSFILSALGGRITAGDIRTARDIVLDRWTWP